MVVILRYFTEFGTFWGRGRGYYVRMVEVRLNNNNIGAAFQCCLVTRQFAGF